MHLLQVERGGGQRIYMLLNGGIIRLGTTFIGGIYEKTGDPRLP